MTGRTGRSRFKRLSNLPEQRPRTKAGQIRWLWPEIQAAINAGHTLREIWEALAEDGIRIHYSNFRFYVARLRRIAELRSEKPALTVQPHSDDLREQSGHTPDPLANVKEREANRPRFEYRPGLDEDKLF